MFTMRTHLSGLSDLTRFTQYLVCLSGTRLIMPDICYTCPWQGTYVHAPSVSITYNSRCK